MSAKTLIKLSIESDYYEVLLSGHIIYRIRCWVEGDPRPQAISLGDLPEQVQEVIVKAIIETPFTPNENLN